MLDEIERLDRENGELCGFRDKFHAADKQAAVLREQLRTVGSRTVAADVIFVGCPSVGALIMGYAPSLWATQPAGVLALIAGGLLIALGISARLVLR